MRAIQKYTMRDVSRHPDRLRRLSQLNLFGDNDRKRLRDRRKVRALFSKKLPAGK